MNKNKSNETSGLDDPGIVWLQRKVFVTMHPEWGQARVLRWYPASGGVGQRLRIHPANTAGPKIVTIMEVTVVKD